MCITINTNNKNYEKHLDVFRYPLLKLSHSWSNKISLLINLQWSHYFSKNHNSYVTCFYVLTSVPFSTKITETLLVNKHSPTHNLSVNNDWRVIILGVIKIFSYTNSFKLNWAIYGESFHVVFPSFSESILRKDAFCLLLVTLKKIF